MIIAGEFINEGQLVTVILFNEKRFSGYIYKADFFLRIWGFNYMLEFQDKNFKVTKFDAISNPVKPIKGKKIKDIEVRIWHQKKVIIYFGVL